MWLKEQRSGSHRAASDGKSWQSSVHATPGPASVRSRCGGVGQLTSSARPTAPTARSLACVHTAEPGPNRHRTSSLKTSKRRP